MKYETLDAETVEQQFADGRSIENILADSEYQTNWTNHWDVNPKEHGGCFVKFDEWGYWEVIVTTPSDTYPEGSACDIEEFDIYPGDSVWNLDEFRSACQDAPESFESDPLVGFTDDMRKFADQYSHNGPSPLDLVSIKSSIGMDFHSYYGAYHLGGRENWVDPDDYWDKLESKGIDTEEFR